MTNREFRKQERWFYRTLRRHRNNITAPGAPGLVRAELEGVRSRCATEFASWLKMPIAPKR